MSSDASDKASQGWCKLPTELQLEISNLLPAKDAVVSKLTGLAIDPKREQAWSSARVWGSIFNPKLHPEAITRLLSNKYKRQVEDILLVGHDLLHLYRGEKLARPLHLHLQIACSNTVRADESDFWLPHFLQTAVRTNESDIWMKVFHSSFQREERKAEYGTSTTFCLRGPDIVLYIDSPARMEDLLRLGTHDAWGLQYKGSNKLQTLGLRWHLHPSSNGQVYPPMWDLQIFPIGSGTFPVYLVCGNPPRVQDSEPYNEYIEWFVNGVIAAFLDWQRPDDRWALLWRMKDL